MADTFTPNFDFVLPEIGGSPDTWGNKLNENFEALDKVIEESNKVVAELDEVIAEVSSFSVPQGGILLWSGSIGNIPAGWALCNGSNGTPDLQDRFVVGAGGDYTVGATGGAGSVTLTTAQLPSHTHTGSTGSAGAHTHTGSTGSAGSHSHSMSIDVRNRSGSLIAANRIAEPGTSTQTNSTWTTNNAGSHTHSVSINSNGAHTHTVNIGSTGGGGSHENRPPYYALAYIMKL